jgi:hypothetical protein
VPRAGYRFADIPIYSRTPAAQAPSVAELPPRLRRGVESLSGVSMQGVKVHRNSTEPARWQAQAFARGADIHLAPGEERQLPHEAWHVVQQKQGRAKPAQSPSTGATLVDDPALENEADRMGPRAARADVSEVPAPTRPGTAGDGIRPPALQRKKVPNEDFGEFETTKFVEADGRGVEIVLKFTPDPAKVDATKIAFTQSVQQIAPSGDAYSRDPNVASKTVPKGEAGHGFAIDTPPVSNNNNPLYGERNTLGASQDLKDTPRTSNPTADLVSLGVNTNYEMGCCYKEKPADAAKKTHPAGMWDKPRSAKRKGDSTTFETTALAVDGADKGKYYGSVAWGFKFEGTDAAPTVTKSDITLASKGTPTVNFIAPAKLWNAGKALGTLQVSADPEATVLKADRSGTEKLAKGTKLKQLETVAWESDPAVKAEVLRADGRGSGKIIFIKNSDAIDAGDGLADKKLPIP